jgi:hypothetical protein
MDRTPAFDAVALTNASRVPEPNRHLPTNGFGFRSWAAGLAGTIFFGSLASPAIAASEPSTRLVRCGDDSCLQISGRRSDLATIVRINGHVVPVEGEHSWRVHLPVETIRQWSVPYARTIEVSLHEPKARDETISSVDLPIGLLGGVTELASLVVRVR